MPKIDWKSAAIGAGVFWAYLHWQASKAATVKTAAS